MNTAALILRVILGLVTQPAVTDILTKAGKKIVRAATKAAIDHISGRVAKTGRSGPPTVH